LIFGRKIGLVLADVEGREYNGEHLEKGEDDGGELLTERNAVERL
jgi:hypothetical protein